jgi:dihydrofolate reductase
MRKIIVYIASSIDGYIARSDGSVGWLESEHFELPGEDFGYQEFFRSVDTTLMGNTTYRQIMSFPGAFPYKGKINVVFTRNKHQKDTHDITFIHRNVIEFTRGLKNKPGKNIWLVGGSQINALLLQSGLLDQIILTIVPVVLGQGVPLFSGLTATEFLQLENQRSYSNGFVQLIYRV